MNPQQDRKVCIKQVSMSEEMQIDAINYSNQALNKFIIEKEIATYLKKEFDQKYNPTWYCIVGRNFNQYIPDKIENFIYFYLGQVLIILFQSG